MDELAIHRGEPVTLTVRFEGDMDEVFVAYLPPGAHKAVVDDGYGQPGSGIALVEARTYVYRIPTEGFSSGVAWWRVWGTVNGELAEVTEGNFRIRESPRQFP
jgi:hypothetical protein